MFDLCCKEHSGKAVEIVDPLAEEEEEAVRSHAKKMFNEVVVSPDLVEPAEQTCGGELQRKLRQELEDKKSVATDRMLAMQNAKRVLKTLPLGSAKDNILFGCVSRPDGFAGKTATQEATEFEVTLKREASDESLGLSLSHEQAGEELVIREVMGRAALEWNRDNPRHILLPGDQIMSVNGVSGKSSSLIAALSGTKKAHISVQRKLVKTVAFKKRGPLGLELDHETLQVLAILPGCITHYNTGCRPNMAVFAGDHITAVNGKRGSPQELLRVIRSHQEGICPENPTAGKNEKIRQWGQCSVTPFECRFCGMDIPKRRDLYQVCCAAAPAADENKTLSSAALSEKRVAGDVVLMNAGKL